MIYITLIVIIYSILDAYHDYLAINGRNWHTADALVKGLVFFAFFFIPYQIDYINNWWQLLPIFFVCCSVRWIVFDITLNVLRRKGVFYIGNTAFLDRNLGQFQYYLKLFCLFFTIYFNL